MVKFGCTHWLHIDDTVLISSLEWFWLRKNCNTVALKCQYLARHLRSRLTGYFQFRIWCISDAFFFHNGSYPVFHFSWTKNEWIIPPSRCNSLPLSPIWKQVASTPPCRRPCLTLAKAISVAAQCYASAALAIVGTPVCPSISPSVSLSHSRIVSKRLSRSSWFLHRIVAYPIRSLHIIYPFLFYNSFFTRNVLNFGPFKASFFTRVLNSGWSVKIQLITTHKSKIRRTIFFPRKKRALSINLYENERIFTRPGRPQDIPHGGVEGKVGVALQGVEEWNSGRGLERNPESRKHILKIRYWSIVSA